MRGKQISSSALSFFELATLEAVGSAIADPDQHLGSWSRTQSDRLLEQPGKVTGLCFAEVVDLVLGHALAEEVPHIRLGRPWRSKDC